MEGGKVFFSDLFDSGIESGIEGLVGQINEVRNALLSMVSDVKRQASEMNNALAGTSSVTKADRDATSAYVAEIEKLHSANDKLTKSLAEVQNQLNGLKNAKKNEKSQSDALLTSYASLQDLLEKTKISLDDLGLSEKARIQIAKNGQIANNALGGSYNQLYAQYNLVKTALNAMTDSMRNSEQVGKVWEAEALRLMNTMKAMQEATGKHTLSVGDYAKAFNGLSISTQQVLRELPTLANSWSQFFIAISNNVPIFVDNFKRVREETGSTLTALKGVVTAVFSWQTALLVVLTILPKVAKAISDKKKAQEEEAKAQEKATKEAEKAEKSYRTLANIYADINKSASASVVEINVLTKILDDNNRSIEHRIGAGQRLKQIFDEELEGYSAEEIAMGKAKGLIKDLTTLIYQQAKARSTLNEITELTQKQLELEERAKLYENYKYGTRTVKEFSDALDEANKRGERLRLGAAEQEAVNTYRAIVGEMTGLQTQINKLSEGIDPSLLIDEEKQEKAQKGTKESLDKIKDYYYEFYESLIKVSTTGEEQEIALSNLAFEKKIEGYRKALEEIKGNGEEEKKQRIYLNNLLVNLEIERQDTERNIQIKYDEIRRKEAEKRRKEAYNASVKEADNQLKIATNQADVEHRNIVRANKDKGKAEVAYWEERIRLAKEYGGEYLKDLELFESNLAKARKKAETGVDSASGKTSKKRTGGWLYSFLYGEAEREDKPVEELANFVSNLESMKDRAIGFLNDMIDKRIELAEVAVEAAQKETEASKTALDYEMEARANRYANNVELARKEYEERLAAERNAIKEKEKLQKQQEAINSAIQVSDLITATASILKNYAGIPIVGQILALAAIAAMWGTFAAAKVTAAQMTQYGEGMSEYLDYGGSHASGNDIDFGVDKRGRHRRVERGEMIGVINKRNVEKYGVNTISGIIDSLNKGTFENKYTLADVVAPEMNADLYHLAFAGLERDMTDLGGVESKLQTLVEQGETRVVTTPYGRIEYKGNNKRIIRNS